MTLMHQLARLSEDDRRRIVDDFLDEVLGGLDIDPELAARMRMTRPDLPDDPSPEQVEALDRARRARRRPGLPRAHPGDVRARRGRPRRGAVAAARRPPRRRDPARDDRAAAAATAELVAELAGGALAAGIDPRSQAASPIVDELVAAFAAAHGRADDADYRTWLVQLLETFTDRRAERYWQLLAVINGWPARPATVPPWEWFLEALRAGG